MLTKRMCLSETAKPKEIEGQSTAIIKICRLALARVIAREDLDLDRWRHLEYRSRKPINPNPWR